MREREAPPRVHLETYGCQMNVYDSAAIGGLLAAAGWAVTDDPDGADVLLINTCSVREHAEQRVLSRVGELRRRRALTGRPRLIGVCGCMAERLAGELLAGGRAADLAVGVDQYDRLPELLARLLAEAPPAAGGGRDAEAAPRLAVGHRDDAHYVAPPELYPANNSHLVTIHKGCDYRCTYCIVPAVRGPQREKAPAVILDEVARIVAGGGTEVTLLGQNVTAYRWRRDGRELDFAGLLARVAAVPGLRRVRFLTGHPRDLTERLIEAVAAAPIVCPSFHVPAQSGSDRVLRRMKRLTTRAGYLGMVETARRLIPDATFSGDFIVGFPGETEDDFRQTLELVRDVGYDQTFLFKYSPRPGTPAARLPDDVPLAVKKERLARLAAAQAEVWRGLASAQVGRIWEAVVEAPARRPAGWWRARTANNRKVVVRLPAGAPGQELRVRVVGFRDTTFRGEALDETR